MEKNNQGTREANSLGQNPLGVAPMGGLIAKFAIPAIISMLVSAMYNIVDQIFIGQGVGMLGNADYQCGISCYARLPLHWRCFWESEVHRIIIWKWEQDGRRRPVGLQVRLYLHW